MHDRLEERTMGGHVDPGQAAQEQSHDDGRDQSGVVAYDVGGGGHGDDERDRHRGAQHLRDAEPEDEPQQQPAEDTGTYADDDAGQELHGLVAQPLRPALDDGVEDDGTQDPADRVDQRALPVEQLVQPLGRLDVGEQRADDGRTGDDEDRPDHDGSFSGHAQEEHGGETCEDHGGRDAERQQTSDDPLERAAQPADVQRQAGVE
ncbi:MAG: hypothetical protein ACRDP8_22920, partial [Actinopolymorphaceae bacterium]